MFSINSNMHFNKNSSFFISIYLNNSSLIFSIFLSVNSFSMLYKIIVVLQSLIFVHVFFDIGCNMG